MRVAQISPLVSAPPDVVFCHSELACRRPQSRSQQTDLADCRPTHGFQRRPERKGAVLPIGAIVSEVLERYALELEEDGV